MKAVRLVLTAAVLTSLISGCTPSPTKVCDHLTSLMKKELGDGIPADKLEEIKKECVADIEEEKAKDSTKYNAEARCIVEIDSLAEIDKCKSE